MWHETEIEKLFSKTIKDDNCKLLHDDKYMSSYQTVKTNFCKDLYPNINIKEPNLTDHGEIHIQNVLQNAFRLIKKENYSGIELYVLCMSILIHDIGNLSGRKGHEKKLNLYFNSSSFPTIEQKHITLISLIASKHGGVNCDAIGELSIHNNLDGQKIDSEKIAAIIRFADELAEGKQRTSPLLQNSELLSKDSVIYHEYANILEAPQIEADTIILEYNINLDAIKTNLNDLLKEIFRRINKVNDERIYCAHYNKDIQEIKKVTISLKFYKNDSFEEIEFTDSTLVNFEYSGKIIHCQKDYDQQKHIQNIIDELKGK